jgi:peptidoglycan hydrolase CwlO-like protein
MKLRILLILLTALVSVSGQRIVAQEPSDTTQTIENLRGQVNDIQNNEAELKARVEQLNFDLKPENIERHFNGYGSTRPEELREFRRRQLQGEKDRIVAQLTQLEADRARLESSISTLQVKAFQQSAPGALALQPDQNRRNRLVGTIRTVIELSVLFMAISLLAWRLIIRRRRNI